DRHSKGSHELWYNPIARRRTTVPNHPGAIAKGTLKAIVAQSGLSPDEFLAL
ncbi:MAG: addiction module toxin, HicA family, partial [Planctomycetes bacterium RBG_16_59_8]